MADFHRAIEKTFIFEGGYVNDPGDPGGETNFGISKRAYPHLNIKDLSKIEAKRIYFLDYWNEINGGRYHDKFQDLAESVLDFAINAGVKRSSKTLQIAIKLLDRSGERSLAVDGDIGNITLLRLHSIDPVALTAYFNYLRVRYYRALARKKSNRKFLYSWIRRVTD